MKITVNGKIKEVSHVKNLAEFISSLFEKPERIIVELNEEIINRKQWQDQLLREGDVLQLIQFVGGG